MKLSNFIEGLVTLRPYYNGQDGYHLGAEHDIFYAYATPKPLEPDDVKKMVELGWFQEEAASRNDKERFDAECYDPDESWAAFT